VNSPKQSSLGGDVRTVYPDIISKRIGWLGDIALVAANLCVAYVSTRAHPLAKNLVSGNS
jgi:hypothetical protein